MPTDHYIEIELVGCNVTETTQTYRFYGRGIWKVKEGNHWRTINGIYIPARALEIAAAQCTPSLALTEIEIARLCGGNI